MEDNIWPLTHSMAVALLILHLKNSSVLKKASFLKCPLKSTVELTLEAALSSEESGLSDLLKRLICRGNDFVPHLYYPNCRAMLRYGSS
jgi:hypothetical protein